MRGTKNGWTLLLLMLAGVVIGGFIGSIASSVPGLDWLNYGQAFGLENPLVLSMGLVVLTFGLTIKITIAGIIGSSSVLTSAKSTPAYFLTASIIEILSNGFAISMTVPL